MKVSETLQMTTTGTEIAVLSSGCDKWFTANQTQHVELKIPSLNLVSHY